MQVEFVVQDSETEKFHDPKSAFNIFNNGISEAMQNRKGKITLAKCILKKKTKCSV